MGCKSHGTGGLTPDQPRHIIIIIISRECDDDGFHSFSGKLWTVWTIIRKELATLRQSTVTVHINDIYEDRSELKPPQP
jgi:hypothetical protein